MEERGAPGEPVGSATRPLLSGETPPGLLPAAPPHRAKVGRPPEVIPVRVPAPAGEIPPGRPGDGPVVIEADPPNRWLGLLVIAVSQLLIVLDATIVNVALPALATDLEVSEADRQWVVTAYTLAFGGLLLLGGRVADYVGRRRTFLIGAVGFALASGLGGAAQNLETLLAARGLQGAFGALLAPAALALVTTMFHDPNERAKAFAVFGAVAGGGAALGLVLGGMLTEWASWRWTMFVNVPIALGTVFGAIFLLPESRESHPGRIDVVGAVLATVGLLSVVYSFSEAERKGWTQPSTLVFLGAGLSLLIMFVVSQRIVANPLLPLRVLANRTRAGANIAVLLGMVGMFGVFFFLSFYMQGVLGFKPVKTGVSFLPITGGIIVSSAVVSGIAAKVTPRILMASGLFGTALSLLLLVRISPTSSYAPDLLPALVIMGLSLGAVFVPAFNAATIGVEPVDAGVASAAVNTSQQVGGSLGLALLSTVAAGRASSWLATQELTEQNVIAAQVEGYSRATLWAALIVAVAGVITLLLVNVRRLELSPIAEAAVVAVPGPVPAVALTEAAPSALPAPPPFPPPPAAPAPAATPTPGSLPAPAPPAPPAPPADPGARTPPPPWWTPPATDGPPVLPPLGETDAPAAPDERPVVWPPPPGQAPAPDAAQPADPVAEPEAAPVVEPVVEPVAWPSPPDGPPADAEAASPAGPVPQAPSERPVVWPPPAPVAPVPVPPQLVGEEPTADPPAPAPAPPPGPVPLETPAPNGVPAPAVVDGPGGVPAGVPGGVRGVVRAAGGAFVAGAALTLLDASGRQVGRGTTGADGGFAFALPGAGEYVLVARRAGHRPHAVTVTLPAGPAGVEGTHVEVVLTGAATLAGAVRAAATSSPIRGALVTVADVAGDVVASARTDERGEYEIAELTTGTFTLVVTTPSARPTAMLVELAADGRTRQDVEVPGSATLRGAAHTQDGRPIADVRVSLIDSSGATVAVTHTAPDGTYAFVGLDEGSYLVRAVGYAPASGGVALEAGQAAAQEFTLGHPEDAG